MWKKYFSADEHTRHAVNTFSVFLFMVFPLFLLSFNEKYCCLSAVFGDKYELIRCRSNGKLFHIHFLRFVYLFFCSWCRTEFYDLHIHPKYQYYRCYDWQGAKLLLCSAFTVLSLPLFAFRHRDEIKSI